jgi:hypothetical protein
MYGLIALAVMAGIGTLVYYKWSRHKSTAGNDIHPA